MVLNALNSIKHLSYDNWQLDFIDDSGDDSFRSTLFEFGLDNNKVTYYPTFDSDEKKKAQGGSRHGEFMNLSIKKSNADIIVILCDDDAILNGYFEYLNEYYQLNPEVMWAYSKVKYYDPSYESYENAIDNLYRIQQRGSVVDLNKHTTPINPDCACDSAQVTFRRRCFIEKDLWYPYPQTRNLDSSMYNKMYQAWGPCYPTFEYGQCKGVFYDQLGCRTNNDFNVNVQ